MPCENAVQVFCAGATSSEACVFSHGPAVRRKCRGADQRFEVRSFREVSAYSTVCPELARGAVHWRRLRRPIRHHLKMALVRISRRFRKACNLPLSPRLPTASCHLTCVSNSADHVRTLKSFSRHAASFNPSVLTRPLLRLRRAPRVAGAYLSCSKPARHECLA